MSLLEHDTVGLNIIGKRNTVLFSDQGCIQFYVLGQSMKNHVILR